MEVAFQAGTFASRSFQEWISVAERLGLRAMELWIDRNHLWPASTGKERRRQALEVLQAHGIKVTSLCPIPFEEKGWTEFRFEYNLAHPEESRRAEAVAWYKSVLELASDLEARNIIALPGKIEEADLMKSRFSYRQHWSQMVRSFKECAKKAEDLGVYMGVENAVVCNYVDLPEELGRVVDEVGSDYVKVYLDVANANVFQPPEHYIRTLRGKLCNTIHTTDNDGTYPYHLPLGMGTIDYRNVLGTLKETGWDGYLVPEIFYEQDPEGGLRRTKEQLEQMVREL